MQIHGFESSFLSLLFPLFCFLFFSVHEWPSKRRFILPVKSTALGQRNGRHDLIPIVFHIVFIVVFCIQMQIYKGTDFRAQPGAIAIMALCVSAPIPKLKASLIFALVNPSSLAVNGRSRLIYTSFNQRVPASTITVLVARRAGVALLIPTFEMVR